MKIAIATRNFKTLAGHAGKTRHWLIYDFDLPRAADALPEPTRLTLKKEQTFHYIPDGEPHSLDGVDMLLTGSAGEGFIRRMKLRGGEVLLTGERDPENALRLLIAGEAQPEPRFDPSTALCRLRDLFSKH